MTTWITGPLIGFDTETTGVNVHEDRIISAALVMRTPAGDDIETFLINPGVPIPPRSTAIHGITDDMVTTHGTNPAEALEIIATRLTDALRAQTPAVAFNASFDIAILRTELRRHGLMSLEDRLGGPVQPLIDPLVLDRATDRFRKGKRTLSDLCALYQVAPAGELHDATVDVQATLDLAAALCLKHSELADMALLDLHSWQAEAHRQWAANFNAWRISRGHDGPGAELTWP